jgi:hypothetical protein
MLKKLAAGESLSGIDRDVQRRFFELSLKRDNFVGLGHLLSYV